ncbi:MULTISPECIES: sensor histidine kinase [Streptomyces]|uniref:sensor histidine kinase n=1 Tax=Streptomyces TaxID=1883 RepID=UPI00068CB639|nr:MULTISPECIES: sensor histidine kinase [Streptomyces]
MNLFPHVVAEIALGGGLTAVSGALVLQTRGKRQAIRGRLAAEERAAKAEAATDQRVGEVRRQAAAKQEALQEQLTTNWHWYEAVREEFHHLVEQRLPAVLDVEARRHPGVLVPGLASEMLSGTEFDKFHQAVVEMVRETVTVTREGIGRSARAGVRGTADEVQTFLTKLQMKIDEELGKHSQASAYHQSLIEIDHFATRALHMVQRLRILAGSWPGTQRANATFREIIESARGRIGPYDRVNYTYLPDVGEQYVEGRVVEPIAVALAELMINATTYSSDEVTVYVQRVQAGYRIVVEDTGLGMNPYQLADAERLLSHKVLLDAAGLEDERKLGFAVIGRLSYDYKFRVDVGAPSASGGVKAVLLVPSALMGEPPKTVEPEHAPVAPSAPVAALAAPAPEPPAHPPVEATARPAPRTTVSGLPKRTPRNLMPPPQGPTQEALTDSADPDALTAGFDSLNQAFRTGYEATEPEGLQQ